MAITNGKWEALITVPTGGWAMEVVDQLGGPTTVTIPAATYYLSSVGSGTRDLLAEVAFQLNDQMGQTWTCTGGLAEGGTGIVTVTVDGTATGEIAWTATDLRDALGFTGNVGPGNSFVGPSQAQGLWLPDGPPRSLLGLADHIDESDETVTETTAGYVNRLVYQRKQVHNEVEWQGISRAKCRIAGETTTGASFQQFWRDVIQGDESYLGPSIRIYPDADTDATYNTYRVGRGLASFIPIQLSEGLIEQWRIVVPRLVVEP